MLGSSERRLATAQPPEPPPTTTKSNVSVMRIPRCSLSLCPVVIAMSNLSAVAQRAKAEATKQSRGPSFRDVSKDQPSDAQLRVCPLGFLGPQPPLSWNLWQEPLSRGVWRGKYRVLTVIKPRKDRSRAFPKRIGVGTYRSHPGALARVAFSGSLRTGSAPQALAKSVSVFQEGAQRFIAGWSSPVARQAHNLKVIGSNPIPATKQVIDITSIKKATPKGGFLFFGLGRHRVATNARKRSLSVQKNLPHFFRWSGTHRLEQTISTGGTRRDGAANDGSGGRFRPECLGSKGSDGFDYYSEWLMDDPL